MATDQNEGADVGVSTTRKTFEILETLKAEEGLTITEITQQTELPKSTVYRHLATLTELGYVIERDGGFYIGLRLLEISEQTRNRKTGYTAAKRKVFELGKETDERSVFIVEEAYDAVYLHRYGSLSDTMIGKRRPMHSLASGKVILAEWDDETVVDVIETKGLDRHTENTITDSDALFDELETVRERGYAVNTEEFMNGLRGVAVPVYTPEDELLGALGLFGPTSRFTDERIHGEFVDRLRDKAGEVRVTLAYG
jgi:IclR family transcriptional regulator, KDG regulon repressor